MTKRMFVLATVGISSVLGYQCNSSIGVVKPLSVCGQDPVGNCHGDEKVTLKIDDVNRQYCWYQPAVSGAYPLVLFLHGAGGTASQIYEATSLRQKADTFALGDQNGFALATLQGRQLDFPRPGASAAGCEAHWDFYHRDQQRASDNNDVAFLDAIIDDAVSNRGVDPSRIFLMGWSNGGFFSQLYGVARFDVGTPDTDSRIAAVSVFTAGDPFNSPSFDDSPSCQLDPYPQSQVPIMITSRNCDLVCCDREQPRCPSSDPGFYVKEWITDAQSKMGNRIRWDLLDPKGQLVTECDHTFSLTGCNTISAIANHINWPTPHEVEMLNFLKQSSSAIAQSV